MPSQLLHTDSAGEAHPPDLLAVHFEEPAADGGAALLADAVDVLRVLRSEFPDTFSRLSANSNAVIRSGPSVYDGPFLTPLPDDLWYFRFRPDLDPGNGIPTSDLCAIAQTIGASMHVLSLDANAGYVCKNERWLHGRTAWTGSRVSARLLINIDPTLRRARGMVGRGLQL